MIYMSTATHPLGSGRTISVLYNHYYDGFTTFGISRQVIQVSRTIHVGLDLILDTGWSKLVDLSSRKLVGLGQSPIEERTPHTH